MGKPLPFNEPAGSARGAPTGRPSIGAPPTAHRRMKCRRVPLSQGYDGGGAYWGERPRGVMLFCVWTPQRDFVRYLDAPTYLAAQEIIRQAAPGADFL